jgi:hypothetical protein
MWEYTGKNFKYKNTNELIEILNNYGSDNWEVFYFSEIPAIKYGCDFTVKILFKRLIKTQ